MKTATRVSDGAVDSTVVRNAIDTAYDLGVQPKLIGDWNLNMFTLPVVDNIPSEASSAFDADNFPIDSVVKPFRPGKGINKALVGQATVSANYRNNTTARFYVGGPDDVYKYWVSPFPTDATGTFPLHSDTKTSCRPYVNYTKTLNTNKIVIKVENTWASPKDSKIFIKTAVNASATAGWVQIGTNVAANVNGEIVMYYDAVTGWGTSKAVNFGYTNVAGIMFEVTTMGGGFRTDGTPMRYTKRTNNTGAVQDLPTTGANSNLALIAIEPHLEFDLTPYLIGVTDNKDMSESSMLYPIGTIISGVGDITLSNTDNIFNTYNPTSPFFGILGANVELNMDYIYNVGGQSYAVKQFKLFTEDAWAGQFSDEVSVNASDYSKVLKEVKPLAMMIENRPVSEIIWRICDAIGFTDYVMDTSMLIDTIIPVWWTDGTRTAWEIFDDLAITTQTAVYFNARGQLLVKSRDAAYRDSAAVDYSLRGQESGSLLANIAAMSAESQSQTNKVIVKYKPTAWKTTLDGVPALSPVWQPETETIVVRSSQLQTNITATSTKMFIHSVQAATWPYKSKVNIDGEILEYEGKEYVYYTYTRTVNSTNGVVTYSAPVKNTKFVTSAEDFETTKALTPVEFQANNFLTGGLKIISRGIWSTTATAHTTDIEGWTPIGFFNGSLKNSAGLSHNKKESILTLGTTRGPNAFDSFYAYRNGDNDTPHKKYGTRLRFRSDTARPRQAGGIAFNIGSGQHNGYHVELRPTSTITTAESATKSEVTVYSKIGKSWHIVGVGARTAVLKDKWYDLEVTHNLSGGQDQIHVWVDGQLNASVKTTAKTKADVKGRFAMYSRSMSIVDFEYFYGTTRAFNEPADNYGFYDLVHGGLRSGWWHREFVYETLTRTYRIKKKTYSIKYRKGDYFFDEFGPYVHEIREFDVKFEPAPVQGSMPFVTNEWFTVMTDYNSTPFGAKFAIANISRKDAVIHGEDSSLFGSTDEVVNQVCNVLGRDLEIGEDQLITVTNESAVQNGGVIESELSGDWIQNKDTALRIGQWIAKHWSSGVDTMDVTIFGNPLVEIGDIVDVDYAAKNMAPATHKYFVTSVGTTFAAGITTTLGLRRVNTTTTDKITVV